MNDFLVDLQSTKWWLSVVIVGVLVSIVGTFLARLLDTRLAAASRWWRGLRETAQQQHMMHLESLRGDTRKQLLLAATETRCRLQSLSGLVQLIASITFAILSMVFGAPSWVTIPFIVLFVFNWIFYMQRVRAADRAERLLADLFKDA
jgi:hypothetical protein